MEGLSMAAGQELGRGMNEQRERGRRQTQRSFVFAYQLEITNNTAALCPSLCMCAYSSVRVSADITCPRLTFAFE